MVAAYPDATSTASGAPRFAHSSESEFASFLDFYGVRWEYEPRSFPLRMENGELAEAFTPDFYLPDYDTYIELTTQRQRLITYKHRKLRLLRERYPHVRVKLLNRGDYHRLLERFGVATASVAQTTPGGPRLGPVLFDEDTIAARVRELGAAISERYRGEDLVLVGVLRGVAIFMADLMRAISLPLRVDYLALSPYQEGTDLRFTKALEEPVTDARVLIVEDVVDTGASLHRLLRYVESFAPESVDVCTLLDRRAHRLAEVPLTFTGFTIGDEFVVGYGLDYQQQYRNLPSIATLKR